MAQTHAQKPTRGWLRELRTTFRMSQQTVAGRISMVRQSYADLESAEERGAISLASLERAAAAMDCDFVYYLLPKNKSATIPQNPIPQQTRAPRSPKVSKPLTGSIRAQAPKISGVYLSDEELPTVLK